MKSFITLINTNPILASIVIAVLCEIVFIVFLLPLLKLSKKGYVELPVVFLSNFTSLHLSFINLHADLGVV